jgi:F-type H+-transporting ATPase subunit b
MVEYITELVGFIVVLLVLFRWILPVINKGLTQSQNSIREQLEEAEEAKKRLAASQEEYEKALGEARKEAETLRERAQEQSKEILVEMREQAQAEARRIVEQAHQQIEADQQQTLNDLQATVGRLTAELAERIVIESLDDGARQGRIIDRFLDGIEEGARVSAS